MGRPDHESRTTPDGSSCADRYARRAVEANARAIDAMERRLEQLERQLAQALGEIALIQIEVVASLLTTSAGDPAAAHAALRDVTERITDLLVHAREPR